VGRPHLALTVATAWVGVVTGHLAAYGFAYPNDPARHIHLILTGHSWLGLATVSALALLPVILLSVALRAFRRTSGWSGAALALGLIAIQVPAFTLIELAERGAYLDRTVGDPAVFVGLVLQPLVAVIAAWLLDLLRRAVRSVADRLRRPHRIAIRALPRPASSSASRHPLFFPARRRAPPVPSVG
jgi:hypothetical protein